MAINFPSSPSVNDIHSEGGVRWKWNGSSWTRASGAAVTDTITTANDNSTTTLYPVMTSGTGGQTAKIATTATKNISFDASDGNLTVGGNISAGGTITYEDVRNVDSIGIVTARTGIHIDDSITHIGDTNTKIRFPGADTFSVETAGSERLRIDSSGNIGQSVTPSGWASAQAGDFYAFQIGTGMAIFGRGSGDEDRGGISCNYYNTASAQKYIGNGHAGRIYFEDGSIVFSNAAQNSSGAGAAMTLNERLRIGSGGEVSLRRGGISATPSLEIYGSGNAGDADADNLRFHNWGNSSGDYWDVGVNHGLDAKGNNTK